MTREEAILILEEEAEFLYGGDEPYNKTAFDMAIEALLADRPQGEWVSNHDGSWNCSECGLRVFIYAKGNYCPSCGAKMKSK